MRIRTHISLMLIPLFVFVSLTSGFLRYNAEKSELFWGIEQESEGLLIALAAHIDSRGKEDFSAEELNTSLKKVLKWGKAKKIILSAFKVSSTSYTLVNGELIINDKENLSAPNQAVTDSGIISEQPEPTKWYSWIKLKPNSSCGATHLGVEFDSSHILPRLENIQNQVIEGTAVVVIIAIILASLLSRLLSNKVKNLSSSVRQPEDGINHELLKDGSIREINDLNNTFNTMSSLLNEVKDRSRQAAVNFSENCDSETLNEKFNGSFLQNVEIDIKSKNNKSELLLSLANKKSEVDFFTVVEDKKRIVLILGSIDPLVHKQTWQTRSALQTFFNQSIHAEASIAQLVNAAKSIFGSLNLDYVIIEKPKKDDGLPQVLHNGLKIENSGQTILVHTLGSQNHTNIEQYVKNVSPSSPKRVYAELNPMLRKERQGVVFLIGTSGEAAI